MIVHNIGEAFFALMIGHALADYPLQGDFLARAKNRANPIPGVPWYQALGAHALIHGGFVWAITGIWWLGAFEVLFHSWIDDCKCSGRLTFNQDQFLHLLCKAAWTAIAWSIVR